MAGKVCKVGSLLTLLQIIPQFFIFGKPLLAKILLAFSSFSGNKTFPLNCSSFLSKTIIGTFDLFNSSIFVL